VGPIRRGVALSVGLLCAPAAGASAADPSAAAQHHPPAGQDQQISLGDPDGLYGKPFFVGVEVLARDSVDESILNGAIRTRGHFWGSPNAGAQRADSRGNTGPPQSTFELRDDHDTVGIAIRPRGDIAERFVDEALVPGCRRLEIVGSYRATAADPGAGAAATAAPSRSVLVFWSYLVTPDCPGSSRSPRDQQLTLEELTRTAEKRVGETVRVRGEFRGRVTGGDLACAGAPADGWVIQDGPFFVWVHGTRPHGRNWDLDPARPGAGQQLEVVGRVERRDECLLLRAKEVVLLSAAPTSREERTPPERR